MLMRKGLLGTITIWCNQSPDFYQKNYHILVFLDLSRFKTYQYMNIGTFPSNEKDSLDQDFDYRWCWTISQISLKSRFKILNQNRTQVGD